MGMGGGPTDWTHKRNGYYVVTEAAPHADELTSCAVLFEQDVEVWSGPVRSGPNRRAEVWRDLEERKAAPMTTPQHRLEDAAVRLVEMLYPEWVGDLPAALDALHSVLKQYRAELARVDILDEIQVAIERETAT